MSILKYEGHTVICCCGNCINARGQIGDRIKCVLTGQFNHNLNECEKYEFSYQRFEEEESKDEYDT
jgi:hypothetical protein